MRDKFLLVAFIAIVVLTEMFPNVSAQEAADKAQQILTAARAAIGGEKLKSLQSLSLEGEFRRSMGPMDMSGTLNIDLLMPDKVLRTETMNMMGGMEITRLEALNGDKVWEDQQQSGGGGGMVMIRRGGRGNDPKAGEDMIRNEIAKTTLGFLLMTPSSVPATFSYAGEAESPDGKADVLDAKVSVGPALQLYFDQKSHRLLMLSYKGKRPRVITHQGGGRMSEEELQKQMKDSEAEAAKQPDVEYQTRFSDYKEVNGIWFPHKISKGIESETNEEITITKVKVNPSLKPEKFVKK
ncbi:MAG: hypothetical protein JST85_30950 [Acidobacteria bacterium]|nr:hypothetical protein [Acidobacteriota bacterium]